MDSARRRKSSSQITGRPAFAPLRPAVLRGDLDVRSNMIIVNYRSPRVAPRRFRGLRGTSAQFSNFFRMPRTIRGFRSGTRETFVDSGPPNVHSGRMSRTIWPFRGPRGPIRETVANLGVGRGVPPTAGPKWSFYNREYKGILSGSGGRDFLDFRGPGVPFEK